MMAWTKLKVAAAVVAIATIGGAGGVMTIQRAMAQDGKPSPAPAKPQADNNAPNKSGSRGAVTSVATSPPVVVATIPQAGATDVDPETDQIKVTFSKEMIDGNWAFVQTGKDTYPQVTGKPHYETDGRTCVLPVKLEPGKAYVLWFNKAPYDSFMDTDQHKAVPYLLVFETRK